MTPRVLMVHSSSYPVQGVCVEGVAGLLPLRVSLWLKADLPDGKDVALLLPLTMTHLHWIKSAPFYLTTLSSRSFSFFLRFNSYLILREMTVKHERVLSILFCYFNNKVWRRYNLWLQRKTTTSEHK